MTQAVSGTAVWPGPTANWDLFSPRLVLGAATAEGRQETAKVERTTLQAGLVQGGLISD